MVSNIFETPLVDQKLKLATEWLEPYFLEHLRTKVSRENSLIIVQYIDTNGINLRNRLSHGLLEKDEFNHKNSFSVIYTILILLTMSQSEP